MIQVTENEVAVFNVRPEEVPPALRDRRMKRIVTAAANGIDLETMRRTLVVTNAIMADMLDLLKLRRQVVVVRDLKTRQSTLWTPDAFERQQREWEKAALRQMRQDELDIETHPARRLSEI
jgi:hypothetical protein